MMREEGEERPHVGNDLNTIVLPDTDTRVGGSEIDSVNGRKG